MLDRFIKNCLRLTIMTLIMATGGSALLLTYRGLFHLLARRLDLASAALAGGIALGIAAYFLVRNGDDLMDR